MSANDLLQRDCSYYLETRKYIRDLVHGYVYLTDFELGLIDTLEFQRLEDIRQLTCQHVYPAARHTRFEHSLGVLQLTRQAISKLNQNGFIIDDTNDGMVIFDENLKLNAGLAALLHDVGHCPFSHLGERQFDKSLVWKELLRCICDCKELEDSSLKSEFKKIDKKMEENPKEKLPGAVHEQISCILILKNYYDKLSEVDVQQNGKKVLYVDFELLIRSILGYNYSLKNITLENKKKNVVVNLINSPIFDMDKLDYIMRDSFHTGIGTPQIDTHRLFNNMYLKNELEYTLIFTHRAEPVLQNMIEARDKLYMYVYNHHVAVFSDYMYYYIFRRLGRNEELFRKILELTAGEETIQKWSEMDLGEETITFKEAIAESDPHIALGLVPKTYLFSVEAVTEQQRSDSDMIALMHDVRYSLAGYDWSESPNAIKLLIQGEIESSLEEFGISGQIEKNSLFSKSK